MDMAELGDELPPLLRLRRRRGFFECCECCMMECDSSVLAGLRKIWNPGVASACNVHE
jgi:hypothetical protein